MRAIGSSEGLPVDDPNSLIDVDLRDPELRARDVSVRVAAVSVNPADVKRRARAPRQRHPDRPWV